MAELTRRQREFLHHLRFRAAGETGPDRQVCWLGRLPRNRWLVIVPTLMGGWGPSPFVLNGKTLAEMERRGWIEYGPDGNLPEHIACRDVRHGSTVRLTDAGIRALDPQEPTS